MTIAKQSLLEAAKAVLNQYGKDKSYLSADIDGDVIQALRQAVLKAEEAGYTPLTNDELAKLYNSMSFSAAPWVWARTIERAVIERLGLKWGGE